MPGKSINLKSIILILFSLASLTTSLGFKAMPLSPFGYILPSVTAPKILRKLARIFHETTDGN